MPLPDLNPELQFQTARSGGPGGQNVNKVSSKVELRFHIASSALLSDAQKELLLQKLGTKLTTEGILLLTSQEHRSQKQNKEELIKKFYATLEKGLRVPRKRNTTLPTVASVQERLNAKKIASEKKINRQTPRGADSEE
ncbi:MAG: aminoacyl-tRNA hydrolase [Cytophagaceae bacterium]|nr:aminoacyl-tRNA hydrolase [Cytophagaceae bacterium]